MEIKFNGGGYDLVNMTTEECNDFFKILTGISTYYKWLLAMPREEWDTAETTYQDRNGVPANITADQFIESVKEQQKFVDDVIKIWAVKNDI